MIVDILLVPLRAFVDTASRLHVVYLASAAIIALGVAALRLRRGDGDLDDMRVRRRWRHPSAELDLQFFVIGRMVMALLLVVLAGAFTAVSRPTAALLEQLGPGDFLPAGWPLTALATVVALAGFDLGIWIGHYLHHRVPALWELHKVHHSAQALNPLTLFRLHPLDELTTSLFGIFVQGIPIGVLSWAGGGVNIATIWGINVLTFAFYLGGYNLRHSPVWVSYGPRVSRWLVSPAMHQIHHSVDPAHHDRNMGLVLSVWDRWFGTLHVPEGRPRLEFGIGAEDEDYSSVARLYFLPLARAARVVARVPSRSNAEPVGPTADTSAAAHAEGEAGSEPEAAANAAADAEPESELPA